MKPLLLSVLCVLAVLRTVTAAEAQQMTLAISIPQNESGERVLSAAPYFYVVLSNASEKPQRLWEPRSHDSPMLLSFEFESSSGKKWKAERKPVFRLSHQLPKVCVLQPKDSLVFEVHYANTNAWEGFPQAEPGYPLIRIRAVMEIHDPSPEIYKSWTGKLESDVLEVKVYPWEAEKD